MLVLAYSTDKYMIDTLMKSGGGTGPVKPGNHSTLVEKVLIPAKRHALENKRGHPFTGPLYRGEAFFVEVRTE